MKSSIYTKILSGFILVSVIPLIIGLLALFAYFENQKKIELEKILSIQLNTKKNIFVNEVFDTENEIKNMLILSVLNIQHLKKTIKYLTFKDKIIKEILVVDKNGKIVAGQSFINFIIPGKRYKIFHSIKKYSVTFSHNDYFLNFFFPLNDKKVLVKISLKEIIEKSLATKHKFYKYFITDKNGNFLYHSDYEFVLRNKKLKKLIPDRLYEVILISPVFKNKINELIYVIKLKKLNLYFGIGIDKKVAFNQIYQFLYKGAIIIVIIFILSIIISFKLAKTLSDPIKLLEKSTEEIRRGNYAIKIPEKLPKDEIGELYINFELMVKAISNLIKEKEIQLKKLNLLFNTIDDSIYVINSNYEIELINKNELTLLNKELEEVIGKKCYKIFANRDSICPNCLIERVKKENTPVFLNNVNLIRDKFRDSHEKRKYVNMVFYPFGEDEYLVYIKDLTEIYNILNVIEYERDKLSVTLNAIEEGVIVVDKDKNIVLINPAAKKIAGVEGILEGKNIKNIFPIFESHIDEVFKNEKPLEIKEIKVLTQEKEIIIEDSIAPIFIEKKLEGAVIVFRDITEKKKFEKEILKKEKLEAVGMLAAGIAHDFNNILTASLGNISLCELYADNKAKLIEKLKATEDSLYKAKNLTEKLLTFSKGGYIIKETNDIRKIIKESVDFILAGKDIKVKYSFQDDLWYVKGDSSQLTQVFHNLALNSVQAIKKDGLIEIYGKNLVVDKNSDLPLKTGNYIEIVFKDNGAGIPEEILDKIFDPFFSTKEEGSGLGLSTVYNIIKKHDGFIKVNSFVGKGTIFFIYLPAEEVERKVEKTSKDKGDSKQSKSKHRILLMDDNDELRDAVKELLELLGNEVFEAKNGEEAIEIYKNNSIDLVILDLTIIGGMGGKETIKHLKKIDPEVKAVVSSGYSDDDAMANYKEYGFVAKIEKPYTLNKLKQLLDEVL